MTQYLLFEEDCCYKISQLSFQVNSQTKEDNIKKINSLPIETTACID